MAAAVVDAASRTASRVPVIDPLQVMLLGSAREGPAGTQADAELDVCGICLEPLPGWAWEKIRVSCCGKFLHGACFSAFNAVGHTNCCYCRTRLPTSQKETFDTCLLNAHKGKAWAMSMLGDMVERGVAPASHEGSTDGWFFPPDAIMARRWRLKAAELGDVIAMHNLAVMMQCGEGGEIDHRGATRWYQAAARGGHVGSLVELGMMLFEGTAADTLAGGKLVTRESQLAAAAKLFDWAARRGNKTAANLLVQCQRYGVTVPSSDLFFTAAAADTAAENGQLREKCSASVEAADSDRAVRVRVCGLVNARQFNGRLGTRYGCQGADGRYKVILDGKGSDGTRRQKMRRLKIKAKNMEIIGPASTS